MTSFWKFPFWLVVNLFGKQKKKKFSQLDQKVWKHSWNFSVGRIKNASWQKKAKRNNKKKKN